MENETRGTIPLGKLAMGIALLVAGILSFTNYMDLVDLHDLVRFWPVLLIFIGVSSEIDALRERRSGGGYVIAAVGVWLLFSTQHYFGLRHHTALPIGIAVVGLGMILHALIDVPAPAKKENGNGQ
jgi:hypothetical protein